MVHDIVSVSPGTPMSEAIEQLRSHGIGSVVVEDDGAVVGILTDSDLVDLLASGADVAEHSVADCMTAPVRTVDDDTSIVEVAAELRDAGIDQLPVLERDRLVGLVSVTELSAYLPQCVLHRVEPHPDADRDDWHYEYQDEGPEGLTVGDRARFSKVVDDDDVAAFARISGDENPVHLDAAFAEQTRFGRRIVHGMLAASLFSAALACLPGLVIYLSQDLRFLAPVDIGWLLYLGYSLARDAGDIADWLRRVLG